MTINLLRIGSNYSKEVKILETKVQKLMERVEYDRLKKRPFAYTDPLDREFISLGEKEAQQEQKYSTIKHWPSTQMMFDFREASLNCVV